MSQTIWNTNISTTDLYNVFLDFLTHFKKSENEDDEPYYVVKLSEVVQNNESSLDIDCQDLYSHPETEHFYTCLCAYPNELLQLSDIAVNEYLHSTHPDYDQSLRIQVFDPLHRCYLDRLVFITWKRPKPWENLVLIIYYNSLVWEGWSLVWAKSFRIWSKQHSNAPFVRAIRLYTLFFLFIPLGESYWNAYWGACRVSSLP